MKREYTRIVLRKHLKNSILWQAIGEKHQKIKLTKIKCNIRQKNWHKYDSN